MQERYFKIGHWYYPMDSVMFRVNADESISIFEVGGRDGQALDIVTGKEARQLYHLLNELCLHPSMAEEEE